MSYYQHRVQYYETDKMAITHHSNYVRWMEEARIAYMAEIGCPYPEFERRGLISPVLSYTCKIKRSTEFGETVRIKTAIRKYNGVRLIFDYMIYKENGELSAKGSTEHCFLNEKKQVVIVSRLEPDLSRALETHIAGRKETQHE